MSTKIKVPEGWRVRNFSVELRPGKPEGATSWFDVQGRPVVLQGSTWRLNPNLQQRKEAQPQASMKDRFAQSKKTLGSGMYGIVKETESGTVIKKGTIGANEVDIQKRLAEVNGVPKVLGVEYSSDRDKDNEEREGIIETEKANGRAIIDQTMKSDHAIKGDEASKVLDEYLRVRKDIHLRGVAHGDMHDANVTWDGKTMGLIDFGSSKVGYREALGEALGTRGVDHAKFFVDMLKKDGASSPKEQKFQANLAAVAKKSQGAELTEPQAKALIEELYNGI